MSKEKKTKENNLVYSTNPVLNQKIQQGLKPKNGNSTHNTNTDPHDGVVRIHRETKGRGGKGVCIITGLSLKEDALKELARQLKQHCGTGGTVKNNIIEIQGDQREKIKQFLEKAGYPVKLAGG